MSDVELVDRRPIESRFDPGRSTFISVFGKKGEGKSVLARRFWDTWPRDGLCIDVTGDALKPEDVRASFRGDVPDLWPQPRRDGEPVKIRYVPDPGSATHLDDLDRAVGLALKRKGSLVWIDEVGIVSSGKQRTGPNMRRLLQQGRHQRLSAVFCGPRPIDIDPMVVSQSDVIYVFKLPNPADRRRIADMAGIEPKELDDAVFGLSQHHYLRWDGDELVQFPPLPLRRPRARAE